MRCEYGGGTGTATPSSIDSNTVSDVPDPKDVRVGVAVTWRCDGQGLLCNEVGDIME